MTISLGEGSDFVRCSASRSRWPCQAADERKQLAFDVIDRNAEQMTAIGDSIYYFGELGMQEFESTKLLKDTLEAAGFKVELGGAGMPTNLWANGAPAGPRSPSSPRSTRCPAARRRRCEFDRKPLVQRTRPATWKATTPMAALSVGAAFAVKEAMQRYNIPGTVAISFGPAEEQLISRPFIVRAGYFKDVDAIIYLHIGDSFCDRLRACRTMRRSAPIFTFHGKTAHGAVNPWDGKDALDAVELMDIGVDILRQQLHPTYRAHRAITFGGIQPNIIPDMAQIWWFVRDANMPDAKVTFDKLVKIAKGAALMTGTTHGVQIKAAAWPQLGNKAIAEAIQKNIDMVGMPKWSDEEQQLATRLPENRRKHRTSGCRPR